MAMKPGTRVVRGPDWASKKQDNGEGFLGTIIFVPKSGSSDNKVTVIWDSGRELRYRAGHDGKYDLRVFDTAPTGVVHTSITCGECGDAPVKGIHWKCTNCDDFDLCTPCYMSDAHDVNHGFVRIDYENSSAVAVPSRKKSKKIAAKGLFSKAEVMRGPHWKWKNDDGGEGEIGHIQCLVPWNKTHRGGVEVIWKNDKKPKQYRVGGEGCVDVIYTRMKETASGGMYYPDHLPLVDVVNPGVVLLKPGDKVRVSLNLKDFKQLQDNDAYGGWEDKMEQCINELGTIVQILFQGKTCRVQYPDCTVWSINRSALTRKHTFTQNEAVTVLSEKNAVKDLQEGHGGWNEDMMNALGKNGRIVRIDPDGDLRVKIEDRTWIFSPVCIMPLENPDVAGEIPSIPAAEKSDLGVDSSGSGLNGSKQTTDVAEAIAQLFVDMLRGVPGHAAGTVSIVQAAGQGDLQTVKDILRKSPDKIDQKLEGKTALQIACYEGHVEVVKFLLQNKADPNLKDSEEDSPVHYAAFGKEHKTMEELLKHKADVNVMNKSQQTPLHIAVGKGSPECVEILLKHGADPSKKDSDGDTPMHDAINQKEGQPYITQAVLGAKNAKFDQKNTKGFNVLQWAVLKDARLAVNVIVENNKKIVNEKMVEGFTALHIAAANDYVEIASTLIHRGKCNINMQDKDGRTPLIISVSQGHKRTIEVLISACCDVNIQDSNGNTALHVAQTEKSLPQHLIQMKRDEEENVGTQIICALLEAKADINIKNNEGQSPLDLAEDDLVKQFMKMLNKKAKSSSLATTKRGINIPSDWEPVDRNASYKRVLLSPTDGGMLKKEYDMVAEKFKKTLGQATILSISRIQNLYNWEVYYLKRMRMETQYGGSGTSNEKDLFHGTLPTIIDVICKDNLDFRLAGERVGALFGKGTYFATDAKYSDLYAQPDKERRKYMFLVKVLAGKCALGDPKYSRPPNTDPKDPGSPLYDCCVDNVENPRIFCVFDKNQYYPYYLIEYK